MKKNNWLAILGLSLLMLLSVGVMSGCSKGSNTASPPKEVQSEQKSSEETQTEKPVEPEVSDVEIKMVQDTMKQHSLIKDIAIVVKEDERAINIAIVANAAIKTNVAREYGKDAAKMLATLSSNPEKPDKNSLGGLYKKYDLHVGVYTSDKKTITRGGKIMSSPKITWR